MSSRSLILDRVRRNQPAPRPEPELPGFEQSLAAPLVAFTKALARMGGEVVEAAAGGLDALIRERFPQARVIC